MGVEIQLVCGNNGWMRFSLLRAPAALTLLITLVTASAGNAATVPATRVLSGTGLPLVSHSVRLATTSDATPVSVVLSLRPRNGGLLARAASSGSMTRAELRNTFAPTPGNVAAVTHYMQAQGWRLTSAGMLTLSFEGTAAAARRAFGIGLSSYRAPSGKVFRAPDGAVRLPAGLAPLVQDVSGMDTALQLQRHTVISPQPAVVTASCSGPGNFQNLFGGYQPADLATAYNHAPLIAAGGDGTGETIGLVEFTNYRATDISTYRSCYSLGNSVQNVAINGGSNTLSAAIEAELDIEVAVSNAPQANVRVYAAPNSVAQILPMLERMRTDGVTVVSDSWGLCEAFLPPSLMEAESNQLALLAASHVSFFAASGDSGSSDCASLSTYKALITDDPASQPFATGVGGTRMPSANVNTSAAWKFGGGGVSALWPQPAYQVGNQVAIYDTGAKCGSSTGSCREVPDVALDAAPDTGYIMYCSLKSTGSCATTRSWFEVGGTSGAAPLMAAIAADANTYSLANGGQRMGFANPFLYSTPSSFFDVTTGNNSIAGSGLYPASAGYDLTTGLGSPDAMALATALAAYTPGAVSQDVTQITISTPLAAKTIVYGRSVTFSGQLQDITTALPITNRRVYIQLAEGPSLYVYTAKTDINGHWSLTLSKALRRNLKWSVNFPGSDQQQPSAAAGHAIDVIPHLGSAASTSRVARGTAFTFHGTSTPNMHGVKLELQAKRSAGGAWRTLKLVGVAANGSYSVRVSAATAGPLYLRWRYLGGATRAWMTAVSPVRLVSVV